MSGVLDGASIPFKRQLSDNVRRSLSGRRGFSDLKKPLFDLRDCSSNNSASFSASAYEKFPSPTSESEPFAADWLLAYPEEYEAADVELSPAFLARFERRGLRSMLCKTDSHSLLENGVINEAQNSADQTFICRSNHVRSCGIVHVPRQTTTILIQV